VNDVVVSRETAGAPGKLLTPQLGRDIPRSAKVIQELLFCERSQVGNIYDFDAMAKAVGKELCSIYKEPLRKRFMEKCKRYLHIF
jgi:hypothetical protein